MPQGVMSKRNKEVIGKRLRELLNKHEMKQRELATIMNVELETINRIVNGRIGAGADLLISISDHFNVSLDWLTGRDKKRFDK